MPKQNESPVLNEAQKKSPFGRINIPEEVPKPQGQTPITPDYKLWESWKN